MMFNMGRLLIIATALCATGIVCAGGERLPSEIGVTGPSTGSVEGPIDFVGLAPAPGVPYYEYFNYSSYAKRSYVPGYTPHTTSLYENPRDYPWAVGVMATPYYKYAGIPGWFFGSPQGYQSSVPKGSHASKYYRGELGITKNLRGGYAQGMRVVEPAIVPVGASAERGGIYIQGSGVETIEVGGSASQISEQTEIAPPPMPRPVPTPESLEK